MIIPNLSIYKIRVRLTSIILTNKNLLDAMTQVENLWSIYQEFIKIETVSDETSYPKTSACKTCDMIRTLISHYCNAKTLKDKNPSLAKKLLFEAYSTIIKININDLDSYLVNELQLFTQICFEYGLFCKNNDHSTEWQEPILNIEMNLLTRFPISNMPNKLLKIFKTVHSYYFSKNKKSDDIDSHYHQQQTVRYGTYLLQNTKNISEFELIEYLKNCNSLPNEFDITEDFDSLAMRYTVGCNACKRFLNEKFELMPSVFFEMLKFYHKVICFTINNNKSAMSYFKEAQRIEKLLFNEQKKEIKSTPDFQKQMEIIFNIYKVYEEAEIKQAFISNDGERDNKFVPSLNSIDFIFRLYEKGMGGFIKTLFIQQVFERFESIIKFVIKNEKMIKKYLFQVCDFEIKLIELSFNTINKLEHFHIRFLCVCLPTFSRLGEVFYDHNYKSLASSSCDLAIGNIGYILKHNMTKYLDNNQIQQVISVFHDLLQIYCKNKQFEKIKKIYKVSLIFMGDILDILMRNKKNQSLSNEVFKKFKKMLATVLDNKNLLEELQVCGLPDLRVLERNLAKIELAYFSLKTNKNLIELKRILSASGFDLYQRNILLNSKKIMPLRAQQKCFLLELTKIKKSVCKITLSEVSQLAIKALKHTKKLVADEYDFSNFLYLKFQLHTHRLLDDLSKLCQETTDYVVTHTGRSFFMLDNLWLLHKAYLDHNMKIEAEKIGKQFCVFFIRIMNVFRIQLKCKNSEKIRLMDAYDKFIQQCHEFPQIQDSFSESLAEIKIDVKVINNGYCIQLEKNHVNSKNTYVIKFEQKKCVLFFQFSSASRLQKIDSSLHKGLENILLYFKQNSINTLPIDELESFITLNHCTIIKTLHKKEKMDVIDSNNNSNIQDKIKGQTRVSRKKMKHDVKSKKRKTKKTYHHGNSLTTVKQTLFHVPANSCQNNSKFVQITKKFKKISNKDKLTLYAMLEKELPETPQIIFTINIKNRITYLEQEETYAIFRSVYDLLNQTIHHLKKVLKDKKIWLDTIEDIESLALDFLNQKNKYSFIIPGKVNLRFDSFNALKDHVETVSNAPYSEPFKF